MWNLPAPPNIPTVSDSRVNRPPADRDGAPSSMSLQTPPGNVSGPKKYSSKPAHIPDNGGERPAADWRRPADSAHPQRELSLRKLNPPPKFGSKKLKWRVRNMRYWRELYSAIEDSQVLSSVCLSAIDDLEGLLMDFFDDERRYLSSRTFDSFLIRAQREFGPIPEVERTDRLHDLMSFRRKGDVAVRKFRHITKRLLLYETQKMSWRLKTLRSPTY